MRLVITLLTVLTTCSTPEVDPFEADCRAWCGKRSYCGVTQDTQDVVDRCTDRCEDAYELDAPEHGQQCIEAYEDAMACLAQLSCTEFLELTAVPGSQQPCSDVLDPYYEQCPGVFLAPRSWPQEESP